MSPISEKPLTSLLFGIALGVGGAAAYTSNVTTKSGSIGPGELNQTEVQIDDSAAFAKAIDELAKTRVVFVGETHNRYEHHLNQLAIISALHRRGVKLAIGMESFQRPYQRHLDAYLRGEMDEKVMLKRTEYFQRWGYDYRHYRPIAEFARQQGVPLVALNAPSELVREVSQNGYGGVSPAFDEWLPNTVLPPTEAYTKRLRSVFRLHADKGSRDFSRFVQVQLLWDEFMAKTAADYLAANPQSTLVVLAGSGHMGGGFGIPERMAEHLPLSQAVVLSSDAGDLPRGAADLVLVSDRKFLPRPGRLGWRFGMDDTGAVVTKGSHSGEANTGSGERKRRLVRIEGEAIQALGDIRLAMLDRQPGEALWVEWERHLENGKVVPEAAAVELL